jgi:hypothetical protein
MSKPFVEVDVYYLLLLSSEATVHFIMEKHMKIGDYPTNSETLVECESGIDASKNVISEN